LDQHFDSALSFSDTVRGPVSLLDRFFFGLVFALFRFAIKSRSGFPIFAALGVDPNLITIHRRFRSSGRSNPRNGRIRADIEFKRTNPVSGDGLLCGL
jgi:hypothetical protein